MQKYILLILVFTLLQSNALAAPLGNDGMDDYVNEYIEKHLFGLNKYKGEIENILSEVLSYKDDGISNEIAASRQRMIEASEGGDECAQQVLKLWQDDPDCPSVDDLVQTAGKILTTTTDIITGTIHSFYIIFADHKTCAKLSGFRCFLAIFHESESTVFDVLDKLIHYKNTAANLIDVYKRYFGICKKAKVNMQKHMQFYSTCSESKAKKL